MDTEKLLHNYHELNDFERIQYDVAVRSQWSEEKRFFFEGCRSLIGQMWIADRKALHDIIVQHKPRHCFEIGTFTGGGSTFFLTSAFHKIGSGRLFTIEANRKLFYAASRFYQLYLPNQFTHAAFLHSNTPDAFGQFIERYGSVDSFFLDGAESAEQTLEQLEFFRPHCRPGTLMMAHDWHTNKQDLVRHAIKAMPEWEQVMQIDPPDSVGFAAFIHR